MLSDPSDPRKQIFRRNDCGVVKVHLHPGPECTNESTDLCAPYLSLSGFCCLKLKNMIPSGVLVCTEGCTAFTPKIIIIIIIETLCTEGCTAFTPNMPCANLTCAKLSWQAAGRNGQAAGLLGRQQNRMGKQQDVVGKQQN